MVFWAIIIVGLAVLALLMRLPASEDVVVGGQPDVLVIYLAVFLAAWAIIGAGRMLLRGGHKTLVRTAAGLGAIAGLVTAYAYRDDAADVIKEIRLELMPSVAVSYGERGTMVGRGYDGHYLATTTVNGVELDLLIDTGASMVLIRYEDAAAIGLDVEALDYSVPVTTANGRAAVAPVILSSIKFDRIAVFDVPAAVAQPGRLKTGLLGMSFLDMLAETSFRGGNLILRQYDAGAEEKFGEDSTKY